MRETNFIKQNKEKWHRFEQLLTRVYKDPRQLSKLFTQITDDLSFARTFYPNRSVRVYLNGLAQKIFFSIYKARRTKRGRFMAFWTTELPQLVYEARQEFRVSFFVFLVSMLIGAISCHMDPSFAEAILGEAYIDMTLTNIESGDPMAVYKDSKETGMFLGIAANNLKVALMTFGLGALFMVGTLYMLISNGVMVGTFQYFFVEQELFWESFLTIWTHGTLEISAIIIAGAAGLTMGRGLVFPGTLSRIKAFQLSARRGLKIMLGITPIIILAGFIEAFFTRLTETPDIVRLGFILLCLAFILYYFVYLPWAKAERGHDSALRHTNLTPDIDQTIDFDKIKVNGEIFSDVFIFYRKYIGKFMGLSALLASVYCLYAFFISTEDTMSEVFHFPQITGYLLTQAIEGALSEVHQFFAHKDLPYIAVLNALLFTILGFITYRFLIKEQTKPLSFSTKSAKNGFYIGSFFKLLLGGIGLAFLLAVGKFYIYFIVPLVLPILCLWTYISVVERTNPFAAIGRLFKLLQGSWLKMLGLSLTFFVLGLSFYVLSDSLVFYFIFEAIGMNFYGEQTMLDSAAALVMTFISMWFIFLIIVLFFASNGILYHSLREVTEAPNLRERILNIGTQKRIRGIEREA